MKRTRLVIGIIGVAMTAACGGGGSGGGGYTTTPNPGTGNPGTPNPGTPNPTSTNEVTLSESSFQPSNITVPKGTTVTWKWNSCTDPTGYGGYGTCVTHSVTFDDGSNVASPTQSEGTFTRTFASSGTFKYHCAVHGTAMAGQVTVQ